MRNSIYFTLAVLGCLYGLAVSECPNACSGHGACGSKDACTCYQNYQANDCSERTCYFGISHVDTPKGDLNMDGAVSGPTTTVVTGSTVYPEGTVEQYPNSERNEGHYYMECSNKGICNRKTGQCDCFAGYTGTACVRAGCPNDCSGHGTCESIRELAEMAIYNTNKKHVSTFSEPTYTYHLWDQDKTMGCKCDPGYWGADCSLRKCKYGVDPLFYDDHPEPTVQKSILRIGSIGPGAAACGGDFKIVFYDVFGEKYITRPISATASTTAVANALQALPNGVISSVAQKQAALTDVDQTTVTAVTVTQGAAGNIGEGDFVDSDKDGDADGIIYTITFKNNPGILKTLEIDTAGLTKSATATTVATVSNSQAGEYVSRYGTSIGKIQSIVYGTDLVYFTTLSSYAVANRLVKVGNQEFRVKGVNANHKSIQLHDIYTGATIEPFLVDIGIAATTYATTVLTLASAYTTSTNLGLYVKSGSYRCALTTNTGQTGATAINVLQTITSKQTETYCNAFGSVTYPTYLRSEKFSNSNAYVTQTSSTAGNGDTFVDLVSTTGHGYYLTPGSKNVYTFQPQALTLKTTTGLVLTMSADATGTYGTAATKKYIYFNGAAFQVTASDAPAKSVTVSESVELQFPVAESVGTDGTETTAAFKPLASGVVAGDKLLISGRRYTVASISGAADGHFTLDSPYHGRRHHEGGPLVKVCATCVTEIATATTGLTITVDANFIPALTAGDPVYIGTALNEGAACYVIANAAADATTFKCQRNCAAPTSTAAAGLTKALYIRHQSHDAGPFYEITKIVEGDIGYEYVTQCSNRGSCDDSSGTCKCYKGYSNDNCDTQNMLAA